MTLRRLRLVALVVVLATSGPATAATYTTPNFSVSAPTEALARQFGEMAEHYRKEKALQWLGQEMPNWGRRCPLEVKITAGGAGGATTFRMDRAPRGFQPVVQLVPDFHYPGLLAAVFEARVGAGRLIVCGYDLDRELERRPAAR